MFPLLLVHDLADGALGFVVELLEGLCVGDLGGVDLGVALEDRVPDLLLRLLQVQHHKRFAPRFLYFPDRLTRIYLLVEFALDDGLPRLALDDDSVVLELDVHLNKSGGTILAVRVGSISMVTSTSLIYWLHPYF